MESVRLLILVSVIFTAAAVDTAWNSSQYAVRLDYQEHVSQTVKSANLTCILSRTSFWRAADSVRWWKTQPFDNVTVEISRGSRRMIPDKEKLRYNFKSEIQVSSDRITESMTIQNIKAEDQGYYRCGVYIENYNASEIWSNQIYIQPDSSITLNLSSTAAVTDGVSIYKRYSQGQMTSCAAYVFGDPKSVAIQIWEGDQNVMRYFTTTIQNQTFGSAEGFRVAALVVTVTSTTYIPTLEVEEKEILRCEARRDNTVIANSSMLVKLSDTEVVLDIKQVPEVSDLGEAVELFCILEQYHISSKTEFRWIFVHTERSGVPRTINITSGEKNDIAEASSTVNIMQLNIKKYSGRFSNFTVMLRDNGSTIVTTSYNLVLKPEKEVTQSAAVAWKTNESMLTLIAVMGVFIKQLI